MVYGFVNTTFSNKTEQEKALLAYARQHKLGELRFIYGAEISDLADEAFVDGDSVLIDNITAAASSLTGIHRVLQIFSRRNVCLVSAAEDYSFGRAIDFAFALKALEFVIRLRRNMVSQTTVQALEAVKSDGKILGRPRGRKNDVYKLSGREGQIYSFLSAGVSKTEVARRLGITRATLYSFLRKINKNQISGQLKELRI